MIDKKKNVIKDTNFSFVLSFIMIASMDNENVFRDSYKWTKINLGLVGAWPNENSSVIKKCQLIINAIMIMICIYIPRFVALYYLKNYLDGAVFSATTNLLFLVSLFKLLVFHYYEKELSSMFNEILNEWNKLVTSENGFVVKKYAIISRNITFASCLLVWISATFGTLTQKYANIEIDKKNGPDPRLTVDFVWVSYIPYDVHKTKTIFIIHWIVQWYASVVGTIIYDGFDCFCIFCILHLTGQIKVLQINLRDINNDYSVLSKLVKIIKRHQKLIRLTDTLEKCINKVLLSELILCCLTFSAQGYFLVGNFVEGELTLFQLVSTILYVLYSLGHFFVICYVGELLVQTSHSIRIAAYETPWYNMTKKEKYLIMFIIQNSEKPLSVTAFRFSAFSYELFIMVFKTSLSYLSVLLAAKKQN